MPTERDLVLALHPELSDNQQPDRPASRARARFNERRAEAAMEAEKSVHLAALKQFKAKALHATERFRKEINKLNAREDQYSDLTPAQLSKRRTAIKDAMAGALTAVVIEHNQTEAKLKAAWARRDPPPYPVT